MNRKYNINRDQYKENLASIIIIFFNIYYIYPDIINI